MSARTILNQCRPGFALLVVAALLLNLGGQINPALADVPVHSSAQQPQWAISLEISDNWNVKPASDTSDLTGIGPGCWGVYANEFGESTGTPWPDGTINKWSSIDGAGNISGGCHIEEGAGRIIDGQLSGTFNPSNQAITKFHLETFETIINNIDGKISGGTTTVVVDGSGGLLTPLDSQYSHEIKGQYTLTWEDLNGTTQKDTGAVTIRASVWKIEQPYRIQVEQIANNPQAPRDYQPASFRFTLEKKDDQGQYQPLKNETLKIANPWSDLVIPFLTYFQASNCQNCEREVVRETVFYRTKIVPDDILLETDDKGQATVTFYPNLGKLAKAGIFPTPTAPFTRQIKIAYYGANAGAAPLAEAIAPVKMESIGIIEAIGYREPGLYDANGIPQPLRWPKSLRDFADDPGVKVESLTLRGVERVRLFRAGEGWFVAPGQPAPGTIANPGALLTANTDLVINACDLDASYGNSFSNKRIYKPGEIRAHVRFFDGVRVMITVNSEVCQDTFSMGITASDLPETETLEQFLFNYIVSYVKDASIGMVAEKLIPYYELYDKIKNVSETISLVQESLGRKSIFVRLNSEVLIETNVNGEVWVTTRSGNPIIFTEATGPQGVPVPAGQTASIPASLVPVVQPTDPETAEQADELLAQMAGGDQPPEGQPIGSEAAPSQVWLGVLAVGGVAVCAGLGIVAVLIGAALWRGRRRPPTRPRYSAAHWQPPAPVVPRSSPAAKRSSRPGLAQLVIIGRIDDKALINIPPTGLTIGRDSSNLVALNDSEASRHHARIAFDNGGWLIADQGSANGTFVNGRCVRQQTLNPGDLILIGHTTLVFQIVS